MSHTSSSALTPDSGQVLPDVRHLDLRAFRDRVLTPFVFLYSGGVWVLTLLAAPWDWLFWIVLGGLVSFLLAQVVVVDLVGSAVRISPTQFPTLHSVVERLSVELGIRPPPAYVKHGGGELNAFVLRVLRRDLLVLNSEIVQAARGTPGAPEMVLGHELAHVALGHLRWRWFLLPAHWTPFLGSALSRAREYQCDAVGSALAADREGAVRGLVLLSVGHPLSEEVAPQAFRRQAEDLQGPGTRLGSWLLSHPPLARRIDALGWSDLRIE